MARLIAPNGSTVNVSDERAKTLLDQGYKALDERPKSTAKKSSPSKSSE
jgi:hypothetical protein